MKTIRPLVMLTSLIFSSILSAQVPGLLEGEPPAYSFYGKIAELSGVVAIRIYINANGIVDGASAACINDPSIHCKNRPLCSAARESVKNWKFERSSSSRSLLLYFAYQLFPPGTPPNFLKSEFIAPNIYLIKAVVTLKERPDIN